MSQLDRDIRAADAMGLSYGYYIAQFYNPVQKAMAAPTRKPKLYGPNRYTDEQLFRLCRKGTPMNRSVKPPVYLVSISSDGVTSWSFHQPRNST